MKKIITVLLILICVGCREELEFLRIKEYTPKEFTVIDHAGNVYKNMQCDAWNHHIFYDKSGKRHVFEGNFSFSETTKAKKE